MRHIASSRLALCKRECLSDAVFSLFFPPRWLRRPGLRALARCAVRARPFGHARVPLFGLLGWSLPAKRGRLAIKLVAGRPQVVLTSLNQPPPSLVQLLAELLRRPPMFVQPPRCLTRPFILRHVSCWAAVCRRCGLLRNLFVGKTSPPGVAA